MKNPTKTVIICSDGAIKGGYIAGAFFTLKHHHPEIWATVTDFTASSTSVGGIFYELAYGSKNPGKHIWTEALADPKLIKIMNIIKGAPVYNIDYLINKILRKYPCDIKNIKNHQYGYYFPLIEHKSGKVIIFNNRIKKDYNILENIEYKFINETKLYDYTHAATAAPILYDKTHEIDGIEYLDSGTKIPFFIDETLFKHHKKIVITTTLQHNMIDKALYTFFGYLYVFLSKTGKANLLPRYYLDVAYKSKVYENLYAKHRKDTFFIYPSAKLGGVFDNSKKTLLKNYMLGEKDLLALSENLTAFMKSE